jgi:hypothetical protein
MMLKQLISLVFILDILVGLTARARAQEAPAGPTQPAATASPGAPESAAPAAGSAQGAAVADPATPSSAASGAAATEVAGAPSGPDVELAPGSEAQPASAQPGAEQKPSEQAPAPSEAVAASSTTIGGYAELYYTLDQLTGPGSPQSTIDLARMVLFVGHRFNDKLRFYSEIEIEHAVASSDREGEVEIEQAFLDYMLVGNALGVRAGVVLVPMGIINKWHEPPVFNGVLRPAVDTVIIPTTWREGGAGIFGEPAEGLRYELYLVGGLNPQGFDAEQGIREGRQEVSLARADGLGITGRVELEPTLGAVLGVSGYYGLAGPNADLYDKAGSALKLDVPVWGLSADARIRRSGFEARAVAAVFSVGDTAQLRGAYGADKMALGIDTAAKIWGAYGEVAYDVLRLITSSEQQLLPFVRLERYDTMASIRGRNRVDDDDAYAATDLIFGISYRPVPQAVFKADFGLHNPDGPTPTSGRLNLGLGVMF